MPTIIKQGEKGHKSKSVKDDVTVICEHVTYNKVTDQRFQCRTVIDFTDVPPERILELASETVLIQSRPAFKESENPESDDWDDWTVRVADISKRRGKSKLEKAKELLESLSKEERNALLG